MAPSPLSREGALRRRGRDPITLIRVMIIISIVPKAVARRPFFRQRWHLGFID